MRGAVTGFAICGLLLCFAGERSASAAQLLLNPDFAEGTEFWTPIEFALSSAPDLLWSPLDRGGSDESGSAQVTQGDATSRYGDVRQCVTGIRDTGIYRLQGWVNISPENPNAMAIARYRVVWYPSTNCSGGGMSVLSGGTTLQDQWIPLSMDPTSPGAGTRSAGILLEIDRAVLGQSITVNYDDVAFIPEPAGALWVSVLPLLALRWRHRSARALFSRSGARNAFD